MGDPPALVIGTDAGIVEIDAGAVRRGLEGRVIATVAPDRERWAIVDGREVRRSVDGRKWETMAAAPAPDLRLTCLLATPSGLLVGTSEAHLYRLVEGGLVRLESFDAMEGRGAWFTPWGGPPATRSLAVGPTGVLYANVHVGAVARSLDGGGSWHPTMGIEADCHQVAAHPENPSLVVAASAIGLGVSRDGGETWRFLRAGLHATYQRGVAVGGDWVLVSASQSEGGREAAVYRWKLGARRLVKCAAGLPPWFSDNIDTGCLAMQDRWAVLGSHDGRVFLSEDFGTSWRLLEGALPRVRSVAFVPTPQSP